MNVTDWMDMDFSSSTMTPEMSTQAPGFREWLAGLVMQVCLQIILTYFLLSNSSMTRNGLRRRFWLLYRLVIPRHSLTLN